MTMKSAYELALERSGGLLRSLPEEAKKKLAEIDTVCKAKVAEAELMTAQKAAREEDPVKRLEIEDALRVEIASIRDRYEHKKEEIRKEFSC